MKNYIPYKFVQIIIIMQNKFLDYKVLKISYCQNFGFICEDSRNPWHPSCLCVCPCPKNFS